MAMDDIDRVFLDLMDNIQRRNAKPVIRQDRRSYAWIVYYREREIRIIPRVARCDDYRSAILVVDYSRVIPCCVSYAVNNRRKRIVQQTDIYTITHNLSLTFIQYHGIDYRRPYMIAWFVLIFYKKLTIWLFLSTIVFMDPTPCSGLFVYALTKQRCWLGRSKKIPSKTVTTRHNSNEKYEE